VRALNVWVWVCDCAGRATGQRNSDRRPTHSDPTAQQNQHLVAAPSGPLHEPSTAFTNAKCFHETPLRPLPDLRGILNPQAGKLAIGNRHPHCDLVLTYLLLALLSRPFQDPPLAKSQPNLQSSFRLTTFGHHRKFNPTATSTTLPLLGTEGSTTAVE
jgi:hypothetical protein